MQVDNPKAAKLYTNLINDGYTSKNLGSIDEFSAALSDPTKADKIYNGLIGDGYTQANLGSQKEFMQTFTQPGFSAKINQGAPQKPLPINTEQPQQPEPVQLQAPTVDNNFGLPSHNQLAQPVQSDNTNNIAPKEAIQAEVNQANIPVWNKQKADYKEKVIKSTPDAITNAAVKSLKIQGIDPSNAAQLNKEKQKFQDQVTNGNATVSFDKDGTPGLVQNPGFFSSLWDHLKGGVTGWYDARKFKDMSVDERVNYANSLQKQQSPYIGVKPTNAGSVGALAGDVAPTVGRYAAGAAAGVGLEALAPETGGLSNLALKPIMSFVTNAGVEADLSGMNGTLQRYYDLKSKNPDKSDKELMQEAAKGEDVDRLAGIGNAALFSTTGNVLGKSVTSSFIKDALKTGADIGAKTAIVEGAKDIGHNIEGVTNKSASDIAKDMGEAFAENAPMGTLLHAFMGTITGLAKVPPLIKSGLKYDIINKMTPDEVRSELAKNVQSGAITPVEAQTAEAKLNEYGQALQTVPPYLSDEAKASVAGLIIKRNNLLKQSEGLDKTAQDLVSPEVDAINNQIKEVYRTGKPEQVEINPTTGETYQKPEYDNIAQQRVQDLAQRIASGKTITKPEDLQTQANFPKELETELQNHLKEDQQAGKEGTGVQENINEYLKQNDVPHETNDISNKETNNLAKNKPEDKPAEPVSSPVISESKPETEDVVPSKVEGKDESMHPLLKDEKGNPITVYHGTTADVSKGFEPLDYGSYGKHEYYYFAKDKNWVKKFGKQDIIVNRDKFKIGSYHLDIKNPLDIRDKAFTAKDWINYFNENGVKLSKETSADFERRAESNPRREIGGWQLFRHDNGLFRNDLIKAGYDGLVISDMARGKSDNTVYVALNKDQIKSATSEPTNKVENNSENKQKEVPSNNESSDKIQNPSTIEDEAKDAEDSGDPVKAANTIKSIDAAIKSSPDQQARDNGEKTVDGRTVKRQKKVKAVIGKPVDLLFSKDEKQPAKYAVIEREDLQPSHKSGIKNENHFIPEAQPRDRGSMEVLKNEAKKKSDNLDPSQLAENNIAYFGSPIVNERGEVIQGNGRAEAIDYYYGDNKNDSKGYRKMIESKADELGLDKDEIAKMKEPVLVRMADVNDERAIILGNHTSSDLEDVKQKGADAKAGIGKLKQSDLAQLSNLVSSQIGEAGTLKGSIRDNAKPIIDLLMDKGILRGDNREMYFNKDGVTPEGVDAAYNMVKQLLFEGGGSDLQGKFDNLPFTQREAIEKTIPAILNHSELKNHIQKVIEILHEKNESGNKNFSTWERQIDMFNGKNPSDIYSGEDLGLASKIDGAKTQKEISTVIKQLSFDMNDKAADMFEPARKGLIFKDALRKSGVDFNEPVKLNKSEERIAKEQIKKSDAQQIIDNEGLTLENLNDYKHLFKGFPFTPEDFKNIKNELNDTKSSSTEPTTAGQESAGNVSNKEPGNETKVQSEPNKNSESGQVENSKPTGTKSAGDVQPEIYKAAIPVPFAQEFIDNDVTPRLEKIGGTFKDALRSIVNTLSPKTGVSEKAITHLMRALGERNAASAEVDKVLSGLEKAFDKMKDEDRVSFIDKMKRGEKQDSPELDAVAGTLKSLDKDLYDAIAEYKPSITWKDNHFRVLWKVIPGSEKSKFWSNLTRRPLQGSKGFFKQATLADMSEGIEKGGVPQTTNPIRMFKLAYADGMKFVTANRMFEALKKDKMVQFVKTGERAPDFFVPINDNIAKVYFKADAGLVKAGEYYIEEGAGRLLNNHLSRDLIREHSVGKGLMEIKNLYTQVELGLSGFHAIAEGLETVSSDLGLGFRKLFNMGIRGDFKMAGEGIMDILKAPFSPKTTFTMGRNVIRFATEKEFENSDFGKAWLKKMPDAKQYITDFFNGGGLLKQSEDLRANTFQSLKEQAGKDNYIGAALRALPAMNEAILSPLFNHYIPALKVGMFFKEFPVTLKENEARLQKGTTTRDELARKTINFIDDRLGEMNFDNLFWNRTFKTATQFFMRSVTWKMGNLRAMLGAIPEQAQEFINAAKEKRAPLLMPKTAWIFGLSAMQIALSTVIMKMFTNKTPQNFKDIVAPQINPDDEKDRVIMPTYYKDMLHLWHSKLGYVTTSMSGPFSKMIDIWNNKDFYNYEIHDEHDSFLQKRKDDVLYFIPKPFSITSAAQQLESGDGGKAVMSFFGLNKAPGYLTNSDIENEIFDLYNVRNTNVKPKAEKEGNDIKKQIRELYKDDKRQEAQAMADKAVKDGILRPTQIKYLFSHAGKEGSPAQFFFKELPYEDKKYLVGKMTDEEKKIYDPRGKFK